MPLSIRDEVILELVRRGYSGQQIRAELARLNVKLSVRRIRQIAVANGTPIVHMKLANQPPAAVLDLLIAQLIRFVGPNFGYRYVLGKLQAAAPFWHFTHTAVKNACTLLASSNQRPTPGCC